MILTDIDIHDFLDTLVPDKEFRNHDHVNSGSLDIRLGTTVKKKKRREWQAPRPIVPGELIAPSEFILVPTFERVVIPNGYGADLRLKSTIARRGFNHNLAVWVDPGWDGRLTMEISNVLWRGWDWWFRNHNWLALNPGERFAQLIIHTSTGPSAKPYQGRYQNARDVEGEKASK